MVLAVAALTLAACDGQTEESGPRVSRQIDGYVLQIDDPRPSSGARVVVTFPAGAADDYVSGYYFDLERFDADQWTHVAVLGAPIGNGDQPSIAFPAKSEEEERFQITSARISKTPALLQLPQVEHGVYRIAQTLHRSTDQAKLTLAVKFIIE